MFKHKALFLGSMTVLVAGFALGNEAVPNWAAPATWTPSRSGGVHALTDITFPIPFIGITPCRVADTRGNGFTGQYGPPSLAANTTRSFTIGGQCGIPDTAAAVSFNFAALNVAGAGDLRVFPAGGMTPLVSTLNYNASTPNIANAAVVPLGNMGAITVQADAVPIDLIIDVNGYYSPFPATPGLPFAIETVVGTNVGAIEGFNDGTAGTTFGVLGEITSNTPGGNSAGVRGINNGTSVAGIGVWGSQAGYGYGVVGTAALGVGVYGSSSATAGLPPIIGVWGETASTVGFAVFASGNFEATGSKAFVEPHPTDASKVIRYISLEGRESGTYFRGSAEIVGGRAVIDVPEDFRIVSDMEGLTVQLTPVGAAASMYVVSEDLNQIVVHSNRDVRFHYMVNGVRKAYKDYQVIADGNEFMPRSPSDRIPGYLAEENRQRLISNGTYNPDGSVNMQTAERLGWAKVWGEQSAEKASAPGQEERWPHP